MPSIEELEKSNYKYYKNGKLKSAKFNQFLHLIPNFTHLHIISNSLENHRKLSQKEANMTNKYLLGWDLEKVWSARLMEVEQGYDIGLSIIYL